MKKIQNKYIILGTFILIGLIGGFLYWRLVGCSSGSCPITSNWYSSAFAGGIIGYLTGDSINDYRTKRAKKQNTL